MFTYLIYGAIVLVFAFFVLFIWLMIQGDKKFEELKRQTLARSVPARARVLSVNHAGGGSVVGGVRKLGLRLNLNIEHPSRGSYETTAVWLVNELLIPQIQPQNVLPVLVNADDPARVYPSSDGMEFADWLFRRI